MNGADLNQLLSRMRREVERLCADNPDLDLRDAYHQVVSDVFMKAAESLEASPFEARLLDDVSRLERDYGGPVPTKRLAVELGMDYFAIYYHLRKLEARGLLVRPQGPRSGWRVG